MNSVALPLVVAIIGGFSANYIIETVKHSRQKKNLFKIFCNEIQFFLKISRFALSATFSDTPQKELDNELAIRNLADYYYKHPVYKELFSKILFFDNSILNEDKVKLSTEIKQHIEEINLSIFKVDVSKERSDFAFKYNLVQYNEVIKSLDKIDKLIEMGNVNNTEGERWFSWKNELITFVILALGTGVCYSVITYLKIPDEFFGSLVNLNIAVIMGTGAILLGLGNLLPKNNVNGINNKISKLILISYPSFIIVNILMLLIGTEIHVVNDLDHNMRFNELFGELLKSLGLFITFYFIIVITSIFRKMYLKDN